MKQLVASWIAAERQAHKNTLGEAVLLMNEVLSSKTSTSRVREWARGVYVPSTVAISYMLNRTLPWAMGRCSIAASEAEIDQLTALLWEVGIEDGTTYTELL